MSLLGRTKTKKTHPAAGAEAERPPGYREAEAEMPQSTEPHHSLTEKGTKGTTRFHFPSQGPSLNPKGFA